MRLGERGRHLNREKGIFYLSKVEERIFHWRGIIFCRFYSNWNSSYLIKNHLIYPTSFSSV